jgi:hypothetical protein
MKPVSVGKFKKFDKNVRWNFKIAIHGYGKNVREALLEATNRLERQIETNEFSSDDFIAIQNHEVVSIEEDDIAEDEEVTTDDFGGDAG